MEPFPELTFHGLRTYLGDDSWAWIIYGKLAVSKAADHNVVITWQGKTLAILSQTEVYFGRNLSTDSAEWVDRVAEDNHLGGVFFHDAVMFLHPHGWAQPYEPLEGKVVTINATDSGVPDRGGGARGGVPG